MSQNIIVGGGLGGLLISHLLKNKDLPLVGFEKSSRLGGSLEVGHHRLYEESSVALLKGVCPEVEWQCIDEEPKERRKGEWHNLQSQYTTSEHYFLGKKFFHPNCDFASFVDKLAAPVRENFHVNKEVEKIEPDKKLVTCVDGSEWNYDTLYWCADIRSLLNAWQGDKAALLKSLKKLERYPAGLNLDWELAEGVLPVKNSSVFPLRYKDKKLNAIGIEESTFIEGNSNRLLHWMLFLDREVAEDREEVAKYVRTLKRELHKEFPELKALIKREKISFASEIPAESAVAVESLSVLADIVYVGPDICLSDEDVHLTHLDRTVSNFRHIQANLS